MQNCMHTDAHAHSSQALIQGTVIEVPVPRTPQSGDIYLPDNRLLDIFFGKHGLVGADCISFGFGEPLEMHDTHGNKL